MLEIPTTIADNAGLDSAELIAQLRAEHHKENNNAGIDVITGSAISSSSGVPNAAWEMQMATGHHTARPSLVAFNAAPSGFTSFTNFMDPSFLSNINMQNKTSTHDTFNPMPTYELDLISKDGDLPLPTTIMARTIRSSLLLLRYPINGIR
ncbi:T-complex protein 1 subunit beta [Tanacetum coccineum]